MPSFAKHHWQQGQANQDKTTASGKHFAYFPSLVRWSMLLLDLILSFLYSPCVFSSILPALHAGLILHNYTPVKLPSHSTAYSVKMDTLTQSDGNFEEKEEKLQSACVTKQRIRITSHLILIKQREWKKCLVLFPFFTTHTDMAGCFITHPFYSRASRHQEMEIRYCCQEVVHEGDLGVQNLLQIN